MSLHRARQKSHLLRIGVGDDGEMGYGTEAALKDLVRDVAWEVECADERGRGVRIIMGLHERC